LGEELFGCLGYSRIPWLAAACILYYPELQFLLVLVDGAVGSPCTAVAKPCVLMVFYRSG
jgi:hypothetical protein